MLDELQSKIEASHERLTTLTNDIERMRSIEDALVKTDQSIAASADDLKSFVNAASDTHQSLIDAADAFKDAANTLGMIDVVKLSETINAGNDQIRAEVMGAETRSREELKSVERIIADAVAETSNEARAEIGRNVENARQDMKTAERRLTDSVVSTSEATRKQIESSTTELNEGTRKAVATLKWIGGATFLATLGVLGIAALILVSG